MIPVSSTTITVQRDVAAQTDDPYGETTVTLTTIATNVRAVISPPSGLARLVGGSRSVYDAMLRCDPTSIDPQDVVTDDSSGQQWTVLWVTNPSAFGITFTEAALRIVEGAF
jgi:hypothetical protein